MELKDFVKETITQIVSGVEEAQEQVRESGGYLNPAHRVSSNISGGSHFGTMEDGQNVFLVDFDVAVTVNEETGTDAKAKLNVAGMLSLSAGGESGGSSSSTNRINFKVPLALPVDKISKKLLRYREQEEEEKARRYNEG